MPETLNILIVEDDTILAVLVRDVVAMTGHNTHTLSNGAETLYYLQENRPHILILDLHLPDVHGMDILQFLKDENRLNETQIIVITADSELQQKVASYTISLLKPATINQISTALTRAIQQIP